MGVHVERFAHVHIVCSKTKNDATTKMKMIWCTLHWRFGYDKTPALLSRPIFDDEYKNCSE